MVVFHGPCGRCGRWGTFPVTDQKCDRDFRCLACTCIERKERVRERLRRMREAQRGRLSFPDTPGHLSLPD